MTIRRRCRRKWLELLRPWDAGSRKLASMMDLIEQECPGHIVCSHPHDFLACAETAPALPNAMLVELQLGGDLVVAAVVFGQDFADGCRRCDLNPLHSALLHGVAENDFLANHQPGDFGRGACLGIRAVGRAIQRNAADYFARDGRLSLQCFKNISL